MEANYLQSLKIIIIFLHSYLPFYPENVGAANDEQVERCHQDYENNGNVLSRKMDDYCWILKEENQIYYLVF